MWLGMVSIGGDSSATRLSFIFILGFIMSWYHLDELTFCNVEAKIDMCHGTSITIDYTHTKRFKIVRLTCRVNGCLSSNSSR